MGLKRVENRADGIRGLNWKGKALGEIPAATKRPEDGFVTNGFAMVDGDLLDDMLANEPWARAVFDKDKGDLIVVEEKKTEDKKSAEKK